MQQKYLVAMIIAGFVWAGVAVASDEADRHPETIIHVTVDRVGSAPLAPEALGEITEESNRRIAELQARLMEARQHPEAGPPFEYGEVPRVYQEALLVHMYGTKQPVYLPGRTLDPEYRRQIEDFSRIYNGYGRDKRAAAPELSKRYGDSYFFYHIYGFSSGTR